MRHFYRGVIVIWSLATFILALFVALIPMLFNNSFFQNIWEKAGVYDEMNISEEELTKVIDHTMDYMWGRNDDLQIQVELRDGTIRDFYVNWGEDSDGKMMDELAHMADCKVLFMGGKSLAILSAIVWVMCTVALILERKGLNPKDINASYITYGAILLIMGIFAICVLVDFDAAFTTFHKIFFSSSNVSWMYPSRSFMIRMLPEEELFAAVVYRTLIQFFAIFAVVIAGTIIIQKKAFKKPIQIATDQQS